VCYSDLCGGLDLRIVWKIVYGCIAGMVVVILPFAIFFYEADDEGMNVKAAGGGTFAQRLNCGDCKRSFMSALCYELITLTVAVIVLIITWKYLGIARLPIRSTYVNIANIKAIQPISSVVAAKCIAGAANQLCACGTGVCSFSVDALFISVTLIIYLGALLAFVGWFLFCIYVGIGLVAVPMDLFSGFKHRPKVFSHAEEVLARNGLRKKAEELIAVGERLGKNMIEFKKDKHSRSERRKQGLYERMEMNQYRLLVQALETELEQFDLCCPENFREHYNPFVPYLKLLGGFFSSILTVLWILHIILYMLFDPYISTFLNKFLIFFDGFFPLFGTLSVGIFGLYLLMCAAKGNFKFGARFLLISIHPMEMGKTLMNSFLFNLALILLSVLPVVQFCTQAFNTYARLTDADVIFSSTMRYLKFFRYFWAYNAFLFAILAVVLLSAIYFSVASSDRDHLKQVMNKIKAKKAGERKDMDRVLRTHDGAIEGIEMSSSKKKRKK